MSVNGLGPQSGSFRIEKSDRALKALSLVSKLMLIVGATMITTCAINAALPSAAGSDSMALHIMTGSLVLILGLALMYYHYKKMKMKEKDPSDKTTEKKMWERILKPVAYHLLALAIIGGLTMTLMSQWDASHGADSSLTNTIGLASASTGVALAIAGLIYKYRHKEKAKDPQTYLGV